jgi:hypothetical protein
VALDAGLNSPKKVKNVKKSVRTDEPMTSSAEKIKREEQGKDRAPLLSNPSDRNASANEFDHGDFANLVKAAKERGDFKPREPKPFEKEQLDSMWKEKLPCWNPNHKPPGPGMRWYFDQGILAGLGEPFGFVLKSLKQIEEDRKEEERLRFEVEKEKKRQEVYDELIHDPVIRAMLKEDDLDPDDLYINGDPVREFLNKTLKEGGRKGKAVKSWPSNTDVKLNLVTKRR